MFWQNDSFGQNTLIRTKYYTHLESAKIQCYPFSFELVIGCHLTVFWILVSTLTPAKE